MENRSEEDEDDSEDPPGSPENDSEDSGTEDDDYQIEEGDRIFYTRVTLSKVGTTLTHLDLSGHGALTNDVLAHGLDPYAPALASLLLAHLPELTDAGVAAFFGACEGAPLVRLDLACNAALGTDALAAVLVHSGGALQALNISGWKDIGEVALSGLAGARELRTLEVGWCRAMDYFVMKKVLEGCRALVEIKVWGCNRVEGKWGVTRRGVKIHGIESATVL
ncbi:hypothetical protein B0H15DRAFT_973680 [Mycena belliarum]|uniref:Uncharacterized protein n=1 Tax=Mycena belliarum TaxID=1033014 RepID=A0AAD6TKB5_9AGAR|nr:hypothetical protein B0H15DRAFT_973680 [Mycena belliae]